MVCSNLVQRGKLNGVWNEGLKIAILYVSFFRILKVSSAMTSLRYSMSFLKFLKLTIVTWYAISPYPYDSNEDISHSNLDRIQWATSEDPGFLVLRMLRKWRIFLFSVFVTISSCYVLALRVAKLGGIWVLNVQDLHRILSLHCKK